MANPSLQVPMAKSTLEDMDQQIQIIRENLKKASDRQKSYVDQKRAPRSFEKGDKVILKVKPKRSSLKLGKIQEASLLILWTL